ncbi:MAG: glucose 1-dehydrogenase [archaeon]|jgi:NAD(P)-dependent dehydrogenase (short-subunit alcohol dehydrogenase family)|nr:glucose 1-dehydrogenase [archaeon]
MRLLNKVAVITGGNSGIGKATAILLAKEGAKVVISGRDLELGREVVDLIKKSGGKAAFIRADVSKEAEIKNLIDFAIRLYGRIDILFNNAGIELQKTVTETTEEELNSVLNVNLKGVFFGCKHVIPHLIKQGGGSIINTASIAGLVGSPGLAAYCASKGGVVLLTKQVALDFAKSGVRVNCVCPGATMTPMVERFVAKSPNPEKTFEDLAKMHPMGRMAKPEEIANAVLFLASDESSFITGQALAVDGGLTAQ